MRRRLPSPRVAIAIPAEHAVTTIPAPIADRPTAVSVSRIGGVPTAAVAAGVGRRVVEVDAGPRGHHTDLCVWGTKTAVVGPVATIVVESGTGRPRAVVTRVDPLRIRRDRQGNHGRGGQSQNKPSHDGLPFALLDRTRLASRSSAAGRR